VVGEGVSDAMRVSFSGLRIVEAGDAVVFDADRDGAVEVAVHAP
jgi:hypothetical protein